MDGDDESTFELDDDDWLVVPKWERFQHYKQRNPPWIKVYTKLLHDPNWLSLSLASRGLLLMLWLAYSKEGSPIPLRKFAKLSGNSLSTFQMESLVKQGFVEKVASTMLAPYIEKEKEKSSSLTEIESVGAGAPTVRRSDDMPSLMTEAFDLVTEWKGGTSEEFTAMLDDLERKRRAHLRESERATLFDIAMKQQRE